MIAPNFILGSCSTRSAPPLWVMLIMGLLCFGIAMLALGSPDTLWNIDDTGDSVNDSVLEGLSLPSKAVALLGPLSSATFRPDLHRFGPPAIDRSPFRPPNLNR